MSQQVYIFKGVQVERNKLIVEGPWRLVERAQAISTAHPIRDPRFGDHLDEWYNAMLQNQTAFQANLTGSGEVRFGTGAVLVGIHPDGSIAVHGHQRPPVGLRGKCLDGRVGMVDWQGDLQITPTPSLTKIISHEVAEEGIFYTADRQLKVPQFEDLPFSNYNSEIWQINIDRARQFFDGQFCAAAGQFTDYTPEPLPLKITSLPHQIEVHFLSEKPFSAYVLDERDTSSIEVVISCEYYETEPFFKADTETYQGQLVHRRLFEVFPATGEAKVWWMGYESARLSPTGFSNLRRSDTKMSVNEKWAAVYWDYLRRTCQPGIVDGGPLWPTLSLPKDRVRADIAGVYDVLCSR